MDEVQIEVFVFDGDDGGPAISSFYNDSPLVTLYSHGCIDQPFVNHFMQVSVAEITRQGGEISVHEFSLLVNEAFIHWRDEVIDMSMEQKVDKKYIH